ncbi:MAG: hypothetical protein NC110_03325 [Ruminococcus sp.]|nr:hypothetical protein [Ruminococcus sp.]
MDKNEKFFKKGKNRPKVENAISAWRDEAEQPTDVLGWYTGIPSQKNDLIPEQDSDDL